MSLVYLKNKRNGVTYVYESSGYWDKEKQQARNKRKCIGKLDPVSGELILSKRIRDVYRLKGQVQASPHLRTPEKRSTFIIFSSTYIEALPH